MQSLRLQSPFDEPALIENKSGAKLDAIFDDMFEFVDISRNEASDDRENNKEIVGILKILRLLTKKTFGYQLTSTKLL